MADFNQEFYNTYNKLKRKGGVTDYSTDISRSSFDQRVFMSELPNNLVVFPENIAKEFYKINNMQKIQEKKDAVVVLPSQRNIGR